jgi:hypothetical protein
MNLEDLFMSETPVSADSPSSTSPISTSQVRHEPILAELLLRDNSQDSPIDGPI